MPVQQESRDDFDSTIFPWRRCTTRRCSDTSRYPPEGRDGQIYFGAMRWRCSTGALNSLPVTSFIQELKKHVTAAVLLEAPLGRETLFDVIAATLLFTPPSNNLMHWCSAVRLRRSSRIALRPMHGTDASRPRRQSDGCGLRQRARCDWESESSKPPGTPLLRGNLGNVAR